MDYQLEGKLAFVTAGAHGIGEATADLLTKEGATVIVADCDQKALAEKPQWSGVFAADLATAKGMEDAVAYMLHAFGRAPDILVNNLGVADPAPFAELTDERWARAFDINLMGSIRACRALLPLMEEIGSASVVNVASDLGRQPEPVPIDYGVCKIGVLHLTKSLAKQFAPRVRVNAVSPGPVWTGLFTRPGGIIDRIAGQFGVDKETALNKFLEDRYLPLGIGQPEDVANAIVFLASPLAKFITGANLDIGGTFRGVF